MCCYNRWKKNDICKIIYKNSCNLSMTCMTSECTETQKHCLTLFNVPPNYFTHLPEIPNQISSFLLLFILTHHTDFHIQLETGKKKKKEKFNSRISEIVKFFLVNSTQEHGENYMSFSQTKFQHTKQQLYFIRAFLCLCGMIQGIAMNNKVICRCHLHGGCDGEVTNKTLSLAIY